MLKKKIIISISGGIDSTTTLLILKKNMYYIEAIFMKNWEDTKECKLQKELNYVKLICKKTNIKLHIINISHYFWQNIFLSFIKKLKNGSTPNPDIICNKKIKFKTLIKNTIYKLNFNMLSTGHYAKSLNIKQQYYLTLSFNKEKDQTYFLSNIQRNILKYILFPISNYQKKDIKNILKIHNFINYNKKNSTGICFIENNHFKLFLKKYIKHNPGLIYDDQKNIIAKHTGLPFYTIGETIKYNNTSYKIYNKNIKQNKLFVTTNQIQTKTIKIKHNQTKKITVKSLFSFRFRHQGPLNTCIIKSKYLITKNKQDLSSPGQHIVLYNDKICIGSLIIEYISFYHLI